MRKVHIGIDVGKNGAIVGIETLEDGSFTIKKFPTPKIGDQIDTKGIKDILSCEFDSENNSVTVIIEDVHSIFGASAKSNFQFGRALGLLEGIVVTLGLSFYKITPKIWQKECLVGIPAIAKPGSKAKGRGAYDTKAMALIAARQLYPNVDLRKSQRAEKPCDGIVDALLMAHYAKLKY